MKRIRVVAAVLAGFSISANAATLVVTSLANAGPGSLRDTVAASLPGDVVTFAVSGTIVLTSGAITIGKAISVLGPGPASRTVSGGGLDRVFTTSANPVLIANLTIRDGKVVGPSGPDMAGSDRMEAQAFPPRAEASIIRAHLPSRTVGSPGA
jgi:hypothetical protein